MQCRPHCSSASESPQAARTLEGLPVPIVSGQVFMSASLGLDHGGRTLLFAAPMAGKLLPLSNFSQDKSICNSES